MKKLMQILVLGGALFLLAACGGGETPTPEPVAITIEMTEYAFEPEAIELKVGQQVTFTLVNLGEQDHEIMIGRDVLMMEGRPSGYETYIFESTGVVPTIVGGMSEMEEMEGEHAHEEEGHEMHSEYMVLLPPGDETATLSFTVTEDMVGEWEMGCFELDGVHYDSGMVGTLTVTE